MAVVIFYEKPGCCGNARQKAVLEASGHRVEARSILATPWTPLQLRSFLELLPVTQWFNPSSPAVKSGEIVPADFDEDAALALLQADPLLIRRPLLEVDGERRAGFDAAAVNDWIGLSALPIGQDLDACAHGAEVNANANANANAAARCSGHDGDQRHEPSAVLES